MEVYNLKRYRLFIGTSTTTSNKDLCGSYSKFNEINIGEITRAIFEKENLMWEDMLIVSVYDIKKNMFIYFKELNMKMIRESNDETKII